MNIRIPKWFMVTALVAVAAVLGAACTDDKREASSQQREEEITSTYQERLNEAVPYPLANMRDSLERRNIRERLLRFNDPNKVGYVYLFFQNGQIAGFYTIKGKVSSVQSQMTTTNVTNCPDVRGEPNPCVTVEAMGDDGSYGSNEGGDAGIFFFTTENVLIEWNGYWQYSDTPLQVNVEPLVVYNPETAEPTSVAPPCEECAGGS